MKFSTMIAVLALAPATSALAQVQLITPTDGQLIQPTEITVTRQPRQFFLLDVYLEYGFSNQRADPNPIGTVDSETQVTRIGANYRAPLGLFTGVSLEYSGFDDIGSLTGIAPSVNTESDTLILEGYVAAPINSRTMVGVTLSYAMSDSTTIYNGVDVVTGDTRTWIVSPYVRFTAYETNNLLVNVGGSLTFQRSATDYVGNFPPSAERSSTSLSVPISVGYVLSDRVVLGSSLTLHSILSQDTFTTLPPEDDFSATLAASISYELDSGTIIYANASTGLFDHAYDNTSATLGIQFPF